MKVDKDTFKDALSVVQPALANKEIIEQTTSFVFSDGKVTAYNDEICIQHYLPEGVTLEGIIKSEELYKFLGKVKAKGIDIKTEENEIVMKAGRSKVGFAVKSELLLPIEEELAEIGDWCDLPVGFLQACKFAVGTCSNDMSDPKLTCVHIRQTGVVEATDNFRMVMWEFQEPLPLENTLIPASSMKEIIKLQPDQVAEGKGWVHFRNGEDTTISCRIFSEEFLDSATLIETKEEGVIFTFPASVKEIIDKAEVFTQTQKKEVNQASITVTFKTKRLTISSKSETAWFRESTPIEEDVEAFSFSITPYLLKDILNETTECEIFPNMLRFEGEQWVYISTLHNYTETEEAKDDDLPF